MVNDKTKNMDTKSIEEMILGEERRFKYADFDKDGALNILEFQVLLLNWTMELEDWITKF